MKVRYIGVKPYRLVLRGVTYILHPGDVLDVNPRKIKASKFRKYFELVQEGPTVKELLEMASKEIISLRQRVAALEEAVYP